MLGILDGVEGPTADILHARTPLLSFSRSSFRPLCYTTFVPVYNDLYPPRMITVPFPSSLPHAVNPLSSQSLTILNSHFPVTHRPVTVPSLAIRTRVAVM